MTVEVWGWLHDCGVVVLPRLPLVLALFLAGLAGSLTHCSTMCSGFVLAQTAAMKAPGVFARLVLPYHFGRATTYAVLGAVAGFSLHALADSAGFIIVRRLVLAVVAVIFLAVFAERFLRRAGVSLPVMVSLKPSCALRAIGQAGRVQGAARRFGLGLALGLLPCPLVYGALLAVAVHGDAALGAAAMAAFALGTSPLLMGLGVAGAKLVHGRPRLQDGLSLTALGINGVVLLALAAG
ncbi:MAG: sulfite exporter TauE/SafE family protein [Asticcacaulis sp.]|nr:sulfite exporter TauE/SafE family protein [Asticcacaulis sp.]